MFEIKGVEMNLSPDRSRWVKIHDVMTGARGKEFMTELHSGRIVSQHATQGNVPADAPHEVKGFIVALPSNWTGHENNLSIKPHIGPLTNKGAAPGNRFDERFTPNESPQPRSWHDGARDVNIKPWTPLTRAICVCPSILLTLLMGCESPTAQNRAPDARTETSPSAEALRQASNPGYTTPTGDKQECLGRLVFDAPREMEWGISKPGLWSGDRFRFTRDMHGDEEYVGLGNVMVMVLAPAKRATIESMAESTDAGKHIAIRDYQTSIETKRRIVEDLESLIKDPSKNVNGEDLSGFPGAIQRYKGRIVETETSIANLQKDWHPMDLGLPDSLGYAAGPTLYAFLLRDGRAYKFMSTGGAGEPPFEERERDFLAMLKRFEVRKLYEIPKTPGVCIPFGFIPDDGRGHFHTKVSLRYADRPGVIYTLGTAVVGERGRPYPEAAALNASARAAADMLTRRELTVREPKSIGPRTVTIGALPAAQGGIAINVADPGKPPVRSYSVYTGYPGHMHSRVLPSITVDMRSFTREQERTLQEDPPPLDESLERLDTLLKSIRLRPTEPPPPELMGNR